MTKQKPQGHRSNGEGSITFDEQRCRWVGRITVGRKPDGSLDRRKFVGKSRTEVVRRMDDARRAIAVGLPVPDERLTVGAYLDRWLDSLASSVAESTEDAYRTRVRLYLKPSIGSIRLKALTPHDVARLLADMEARGLGAETRRLTRAVLRRALRRAEQEGLVQRNVAAIADGPKSTRTEGRTLTIEEANTLLEAAATPPERPTGKPGPSPVTAQRLYPAVLIALALGLRRGEVLGLAWPNVRLDADPPTIHVAQQLVRRPQGRGLGVVELKTRSSQRVVVLPVRVMDALRRHRAAQGELRLAAGPLWANEHDLVFTTPLGTPMDPRNFNTVLAETSNRAGLGHWSPHELRHSAASLLLAMGVPLEVVSEVLGHSSIRVTKDVYGHLLPGAFAEAAAAMDRVLGSADSSG